MAATVALYARPEIIRGEQCAGAPPIEGGRHAPIVDRLCRRRRCPAAGRRGVTSIAWAAPASRPDTHHCPHIYRAGARHQLHDDQCRRQEHRPRRLRGGAVGPAPRRDAGRAPNGQCTINFNQAPSHPAALCGFAFTVTGQGEITADGSVVFAPAPEGSGRPHSPFRSPAERAATRTPAARSVSSSWAWPTPASPFTRVAS